MKANELRKGIFIQDIDTKRKGYITKINGNKLTVKLENSTLIQHFEEFEPIELTEKILFKLNKNKVLKEFDELDINKVVFEFRNNKLYFTAGGGATLSDPIEYLHELQNFVFLFSKKELEINL